MKLCSNYDKDKTNELDRLFLKDLEKSTLIKADYYENLPRSIKLL